MTERVTAARAPCGYPVLQAWALDTRRLVIGRFKGPFLERGFCGSLYSVVPSPPHPSFVTRGGSPLCSGFGASLVCAADGFELSLCLVLPARPVRLALSGSAGVCLSRER